MSTMLVATGIHRPNEGAELERLVGKQLHDVGGVGIEELLAATNAAIGNVELDLSVMVEVREAGAETGVGQARWPETRHRGRVL